MGSDSEDPGGVPASGRAGIRSAVTGCAIYVTLMAIVLFMSAGTLDWPMAWLFVISSLEVFIIGTLGTSPELLEERSRRHKDSKIWDQVLVLALVVIGFIILIVAGLAVRFGWSGQVPFPVPVIALTLLLLGFCLANWAIWTNRFFSATVRIQLDRNHTVISDGPYRFIRHPGYAGGIVYVLLQPLALGSIWALIPAALYVGLLIVRTFLEDRTLQMELAGYREYTGRVRYRLVPGVW